MLMAILCIVFDAIYHTKALGLSRQRRSPGCIILSEEALPMMNANGHIFTHMYIDIRYMHDVWYISAHAPSLDALCLEYQNAAYESQRALSPGSYIRRIELTPEKSMHSPGGGVRICRRGLA